MKRAAERSLPSEILVVGSMIRLLHYRRRFEKDRANRLLEYLRSPRDYGESLLEEVVSLDEELMRIIDIEWAAEVALKIDARRTLLKTIRCMLLLARNITQIGDDGIRALLKDEVSRLLNDVDLCMYPVMMAGKAPALTSSTFSREESLFLATLLGFDGVLPAESPSNLDRFSRPLLFVRAEKTMTSSQRRLKMLSMR